jgi:hypothetical protein
MKEDHARELVGIPSSSYANRHENCAYWYLRQDFGTFLDPVNDALKLDFSGYFFIRILTFYFRLHQPKIMVAASN